MLAPSSRWWQALNPAIYLVSILPGVAVWLLAENPVAHTGLWPATFAVVLLQHAVNLLNDAKDWQLGADTYKYDSWVRVHSGSARTAVQHGLVSLVAGGTLGFVVLLLHQRLWILGFTLPLVFLGVLYNAGRRPLSYTAAGEWVTALCYGPGVFGGLWFSAGQPFDWMAVTGMAAFATFSTALLFSHQPPQIETDYQAGKRSFAVRYGPMMTYRVVNVLVVVTFVLLAVGFWQAQTGLLTTGVFALGAVLAIYRVIQAGPNPKRIMLSAGLVFFASAIVACI